MKQCSQCRDCGHTVRRELRDVRTVSEKRQGDAPTFMCRDAGHCRRRGSLGSPRRGRRRAPPREGPFARQAVEVAAAAKPERAPGAGSDPSQFRRTESGEIVAVEAAARPTPRDDDVVWLQPIEHIEAARAKRHVRQHRPRRHDASSLNADHLLAHQFQTYPPPLPPPPPPPPPPVVPRPPDVDHLLAVQLQFEPPDETVALRAARRELSRLDDSAPPLPPVPPPPRETQEEPAAATAAAEAAERARASRPDSDAATRRARAAVASGDESYEVLQALDAGRQSGTGLTKTQLLRLPTCRATSGTCSICLEDFAQDGATAALRLPRCGHVFHAAYCGRWFGTHDDCPLCRAPVVAGGIR